MRAFGLLGFCVLLSACVSAQALVLPDGSSGQAISCNGLAHSINDCYAKAGEMCPIGYDILSGGSESRQVGFASINAYGGSAFSGPVIKRSLLVRCHV